MYAPRKHQKNQLKNLKIIFGPAITPLMICEVVVLEQEYIFLNRAPACSDTVTHQ
jgi:hypothetical protein